MKLKTLNRFLLRFGLVVALSYENGNPRLDLQRVRTLVKENSK